MMNSVLKTFAKIATLALFSSAPSHADVATHDALSSVTPGNFYMWMTPFSSSTMEPCLMRLKLELTNDSQGAHAVLKSAYIRDCYMPGHPDAGKLYPPGDAREFNLRFEGEDCGSKIYTAEGTPNDPDRNLRVVDNRTRAPMCADIAAAPIVISERVTHYSGWGPKTNTHTYYSEIQAVPAGCTWRIEHDKVNRIWSLGRWVCGDGNQSTPAE